VDDFVFYLLCVRALADAEMLDAGWIELCGLLGVPLNMTKHQRCKQSVYSGFLNPKP
jgi:hypothetical protein